MANLSISTHFDGFEKERRYSEAVEKTHFSLSGSLPRHFRARILKTFRFPALPL
jgi:hypothetical protein